MTLPPFWARDAEVARERRVEHAAVERAAEAPKQVPLTQLSSNVSRMLLVGSYMP